MDKGLSLFISGLYQIVHNWERLNVNQRGALVAHELIPFIDIYANETLRVFSHYGIDECVYFLNALVDKMDIWKEKLEIWQEATLCLLIKSDIDNLISSYQAEEGSISFDYLQYHFKVKRYGGRAYGGMAYRIEMRENGKYLLEIYKASVDQGIDEVARMLIDEVISVSSIYDLTLYRQSLYDECMNKYITQLAFEHIIIIFVDGEKSTSLWLWIKHDDGNSKFRPHTYRRGQSADALLQKLAG